MPAQFYQHGPASSSISSVAAAGILQRPLALPTDAAANSQLVRGCRKRLAPSAFEIGGKVWRPKAVT
eukprot:1650424-Rhodomonas_salina.1